MDIIVHQSVIIPCDRLLKFPQKSQVLFCIYLYYFQIVRCNIDKNQQSHLGELIIDNKRIRVFISLTNDVDALIGTRLLDNTITVLDFKNYNITVQA